MFFRFSLTCRIVHPLLDARTGTGCCLLYTSNLNTIKKSYGRVHLFLKTESDITSYIHDAGISILSELAGEYHLKVTGEAQANALLGTLIQAGITIVTFNLREPSLHEIFVSKVGEAHEE